MSLGSKSTFLESILQPSLGQILVEMLEIYIKYEVYLGNFVAFHMV